MEQWELRARFAVSLADPLRPGGPGVHDAGRRLPRRERRLRRRPRRRRRAARVDLAASPPSGTARSASGPPPRWPRSPASSPASACTRSASTTSATRRPARCRSCRPPSARPTSTSSPATRSASSPRCSSPTTGGSSTPPTQERLEAFVAARELFAPEALVLADRSVADGGLGAADAERFLELATASFALSTEPIDRAWYDQLEAISAVAADIGGVPATHINHLTPRVLDIDDLYARMSALGVAMIPEIQGPPDWEGPDVLLRQTSFRALAEPRTFREADGTIDERRAPRAVRRGRAARHRPDRRRARPLRRPDRRGRRPPRRRAAGGDPRRGRRRRLAGAPAAHRDRPRARGPRLLPVPGGRRRTPSGARASPSCSTPARWSPSRSSTRTSSPARPPASSSPTSPTRARATTTSSGPRTTSSA